MIPFDRQFKEPEVLAEATPAPVQMSGNTRFSFGRVVLLVLSFVALAILLDVGREYLVYRKVAAAYARVEELVRTAPRGHAFQTDVRKALGIPPNGPMVTFRGSGQEEYEFNCLHQKNTLRVIYCDDDGVGKPYAFRVFWMSSWGLF
jgi:hypothetical protein